MSQTVVVYIYMNDVMCTFLLVIGRRSSTRKGGEKQEWKFLDKIGRRIFNTSNPLIFNS